MPPQQELNVRLLTLTSNESEYGVKYKAVADHKAIGQKYRQKAALIRNALPALESEKVKSFLSVGHLEIDGMTLTSSEIQVQRYFDKSADGVSKMESNYDKEVLVLLDLTINEENAEEGLARELINRVQRLRKKANLNPTDCVDVYYKLCTIDTFIHSKVRCCVWS